MSTITSGTAISLKNILVATDLSTASLRSLPYVIAIADQYGSTVFMAHVIPLGTYLVSRPESYDAVEKQCREHARDKLDRLSAGLTAQGISSQILLTEGDVGVQIGDWIRQREIDLLAVGTSGRSGLRKLFLGSTAEELVREAPCPVLTVGPALSGETPIRLRNILHATDFSADSLQATRYAFSIARHSGARVILLHVIDGRSASISKQLLIQRMQDLVPAGNDLAIEAEVLTAVGQPTTKILEIANEHAVDLIVIGVRGAGGLARAASHFGSTAHDVIAGAFCPVLTAGASQEQKPL